MNNFFAATEIAAPEATVEVTKINNLDKATMLLSLTFDRLGNARKADVEVVTDGKQDRFKSTKTLLDSTELKAITKADNAFKAWVDAPHRCWKYGKGGMRIVPNDMIDTINEECTKYQQVDRPKLVAALKEVYASQVKQAETDLGSDFKANEYVSVEELDAQFSFDFQWMSFDTPDKLKLLSPKAYEQQLAKEKENMLSFADEMKAGMRVYFHSITSNLLDALKETDGNKKRLRGRTVEKLQEFFSTFDMKNINNDSELQSEVAKLKLVMQGIDADKIRESENLKTDLTGKLQEVIGSMAAVVETKGRKFR